MHEYLEIALLSPPYFNLTYQVPRHLAGLDWPKGLRVLVPLGKGSRVGIVMGPAGAPSGDFEIKPLLWPLEKRPLVSQAYLDMVDSLAVRQMIPAGRILGSVLPQGLRSSQVVYRVKAAGLPRQLGPSALAKLSPDELGRLVLLWETGLMAEPGAQRREEEIYALACEPPWPVRPGAKRQLEVLEALFESGPCPDFGLKSRFGKEIEPILKKMLDRGLLSLSLDKAAPQGLAKPEPIRKDRPPLTPEQSAAFASLKASLARREPETVMLHGVTGSGKTRLYLEAAAECLGLGRGVLLLAPEVALAAKLHRAAKEFFPQSKVIYYHGYLPPRQRDLAFCEAAGEGQPLIVVGTRSALFLPLRNPGLIVLDEEHDSSFKQDERLNYQAKEVAFFLTQQAGALLLLGSATPDIKTYQGVLDGKLPLLSLTKRIGGGGIPSIELVDLSQVAPPPRGADGEALEQSQALAPQSLELLHETVQAGQQAIIMLNRRGYAPLMYCLDCNSVAKCPNCEVSLTYHKRRERLVCHYCGASEPFPRPCANCKGSHFLPLGLGSEMLEEQLTRILPAGTGILRLDRDSTRKPGKLEEILDDFSQAKAQVLIGTQMISKGHHFPEVTLVVVADGDMGLNLPDYRASERTFQLLLQVAGRAGRGEKPGRVLIQTRTPSSPFWENVLSSNFEAFFALEQAKRKKYLYPPFVKLALIRASFPLGFSGGVEALSSLAKCLKSEAAGLGVKVLGPAPAPLSMLRGDKRYHCLLKAQDWPSIRQLFAKALALRPGQGNMRLQLDLDPVDML